MSKSSYSQPPPNAASVPAIRSFEFDSTAVGNIKTSVNQYRGTLSLPIDLLKLDGRTGLDVTVSALYSSCIERNVSTWNPDQPTSILGLGWSMPFEKIVVETEGNGSASSDRHYLVAGGSANPMIRTGTTVQGLWVFELQQFQFWQITYDPAKFLWRIVKENGSVYSYGAETPTANAVQWGVRWDNWMGSSSRLDGQEQYAQAWNLASIESVQGDRVSYKYQNTELPVGDERGKTYTQESYVCQITDSLGRVIHFFYGKKFGEQNFSTQNIVEYQAINAGKPAPNAYQDTYETLFLERVEVMNAEGQQVHGLTFTYDFVNFAATTDPNRGLMYKRVLSSVFQWSPEGRVLPSMSFFYNMSASDTNPGALTKILYPSGGEATVGYKELVLDAPRRTELKNPYGDGRPAVWHGNDYVATTFTGGVGFKCQVSSNNGCWITTDITPNALTSAEIDPDSLWAYAGNEFLAISGRETTGNRDFLCLFRKSPTVFGEWDLDPQGVRWLAIKPGTGIKSTFIAGRNFVIAANLDYTLQVFQGFSWDWRRLAWIAPPVMPSDSLARSNCNFALAVFDNYYVSAIYADARHQVSYQVFFRDAMQAWVNGGSWTTSNITIASENDRLLFSVVAQSNYLATTYVTGTTQESIDYSLAVHQLDTRFNATNGPSPRTVSSSAPIDGGEAVYNLFQTVASQDYLNNNLTSLRNEGGDQRASPNTNWLNKTLSLTAGNKPAFASQTDVTAYVQGSTSGKTQAEILKFDPNQPGQVAWSTDDNIVQSGTATTVFDNYLTIGKTIYFKQFNGNWQALATSLNALGPQYSVQNRAPNYIAYQDGEDGSTRSYIVAPKNGDIGAPTTLPGAAQKVWVPADQTTPGNNLAGARFLISYPSSNDFKTARLLTLYNLDQGDLGDYSTDTPVAWTAIANPFDPAQRFVESFIYGNSADSVVAYDTQTGLAQYSKVTVVVGVETLQNTLPSSTPFGRSEFSYSNGLSTQDALNYPLGWIYNYSQTLNGVELAKHDYNADGKLVAHQLNNWKVFTTGPSDQQLYGSYAKVMRTRTTRDGVTVDSYSDYDRVSGLEISRRQSYFDAKGVRKWLREELIYAHQIDTYKTNFSARHYLSALAKHDRCVVDDSSGHKTFIESKVTTWKDWAEGVGPTRLSKVQSFQWTADSVTPFFDFTTASNVGWVSDVNVISRTATSSMITEQIDVRDAPSSFIYDTQSRYLVATFPGASRVAGQASYWSAEPYQDADGWTVGRDALIVPPSADDLIDAHTGNHSVLLIAGASGTRGLSRSWIAEGVGFFVAAAWVKRPEEFDPVLGAAQVTVTVNGRPAARVEFTGALGGWVYLAAEFELTAAISDVLITYENANTETDVLVDNLCVAPKDCTWSATSFDTRLWLPDAKLEANGVTSRIRYDPFGRITLRTNACDNLSEISSPYQSRDGNLGAFNPEDPDSISILRPATAGTLDTFDRGDEWLANWTPDITGGWTTANGILSNSGTASRSTLTASSADPAVGFALGVQLAPQGAPVQALGLQIGSDVTIAWDPATGEWTLTGPGSRTAKATVTMVARNHALHLDSPEDGLAGLISDYRGTAKNRLTEEFGRRGIHLPHHGHVFENSDCGTHEIHVPESQYRIVLRTTESGIAAERIGGLWSLYVRKQALIFRIDGKVIFSKVFDRAITGEISLFFESSVAISDLALGAAPAAAVNYTDTTGNPLQQQGLEDGRMAVSQFLNDSQGRVAVKVKPIWIDAADATPLLSYTPGMASIHWDTGQMTGLVAEAYPDDGGYPYAREVYETSPLGRVIEFGLPGAEFAIGAHSARLAYGPNTGTASLPANSYTRQIVTDPNGNISSTISTTLRQTVVQSSERSTGQAVISAVIYCDAGNPVEQFHPNYYDPPPGSVAENWVITQTFDFGGRPLTKTVGKLGTSQMIYSDAGDLRFMIDPQGQADGTYLYWKYDRMGRPIESGYLEGVFEVVKLTRIATEEPDWPVDVTTWRKKQEWDGSGVSANAIGRIRNVETSQECDGEANSTESYVYDLFGNTTQIVQTVAGTTDAKQIDYAFDMQGAPITVSYPRDVQGKRWRLSYRYDPLHRVTSVAEGDSGGVELISYSYQADGRPLSEVRPGDGTQPSTRQFEYTPPLWQKRLHDTTAASTLFIEELNYTKGGYRGAEYFDGTIAAAHYPDAGGVPGHSYKYAYNGLGQIEQAECPEHDEWSLGGAIPVAYDANGNMKTTGIGSRNICFDYVKQTQRLKTVRDVSDAEDISVAEYTYNKNGAALTIKTVGTPFAAPSDVIFTYDPGVRRPVQAQIENKGAIIYRYGATGARVIKEVATDSGPPERTTYTHGTNGVTLCEQATRDEVFYGFGPQGLTLLRHNGEVLYILRDHLGSVRRLLDKSNNVVADFDYLPYGTVARNGGAKKDVTNLRFTGHPFDEDLGLYDTRARFYSGQVGRFLDTDPMTQFFSPYIYAANNPVLYVDPDGQFSFSSLFSAIAGVIIGAVEVVIGVAIDAVAGVLEIVTGGLSTPVSVALASAAGAFYGAGASSIIYSVMNVQSFDWKEYGIQMGIGAVAGAISFGFGALGTATATSAASTATVSAAGKATQTTVEVSITAGFGALGGAVGGTVSTTLNDVAHNVTPGFDVVTGALWSALSSGISSGVPGPAYKSGFKEFGKRILINVGKKEAMNVSIALTKNAVNGDPLDKGLVNTAVSGVVWGSIGSVGSKSAAKQTTQSVLYAVGAGANI